MSEYNNYANTQFPCESRTRERKHYVDKCNSVISMKSPSCTLISCVWACSTIEGNFHNGTVRPECSNYAFRPPPAHFSNTDRKLVIGSALCCRFAQLWMKRGFLIHKHVISVYWRKLWADKLTEYHFLLVQLKKVKTSAFFEFTIVTYGPSGTQQYPWYPSKR